MNKRKHQLVWVVMILLMVVLLLLNYQKEQANDSDDEASDTSAQAKDEQTADVKYSLLGSSEVETLTELLQPHQFHEDPFIEAKLIMEYKTYCRFKSRKSKVPHCDELMSRFETMETILTDYQKVNSIPASTELGKMMKHRIIYDPQQPGVYRHFNRELLKQLINSQNPHLLGLQAFMFNFTGTQYGEILPLSEWLGSLDQEYNSQVLMFAMLNIAYGNRGKTVGADTGFTEELLCFANNANCGLSFEEAWQKALLPGMKKDVALMIRHLEEFVFGKAQSN
jgi:hypothetical protein